MKINGNKIRELREAAALSQALLAEKAGVDQKAIYRAEKGNTSQASLRGIARALEVEPEQLLPTSAQPPAREPEESPEQENSGSDVEEFLLYLLEQEELQESHPVWFVNKKIQEDLGWSVGRINDAVELAEQHGWIFLLDVMLSGPFNFVTGHITSAGKIFADPNRRDDPKRLLRFLASQGEGEDRGHQSLSVPEISEGLSWDWMRIEDSIQVLASQRLVDALETLDWPSYKEVTLSAQGRREARR